MAQGKLAGLAAASGQPKVRADQNPACNGDLGMRRCGRADGASACQVAPAAPDVLFRVTAE